MKAETTKAAADVSAKRDDEGATGNDRRLSPDPLYDEAIDDANEAYIRELYRPSKGSDAVLCCPGCFTTICFDCQRHATRPTQYRAMFVQNCKVKVKERFDPDASAASLAANGSESCESQSKHGVTDKRRGKGESKGTGKLQNGDASDMDGKVFWPVLCAECDALIGACDADEVFHFFNVLPSQALGWKRT